MFFSPNNLREALEGQIQEFQKSSNVVVSSVGLFPCDERSCPAAKECRNVINMLNEWSSLAGDNTIFLSYKNEQTSKCVCPEGISGTLSRACFAISRCLIMLCFRFDHSNIYYT